MYCKNCGKILSETDKFCSECGTRVEADTPEVKRPVEKPVEDKPKKTVHLEEFNWDLDGYPTTPKKTEAIDFNWESVLEEKTRNAAPKMPAVKAEKSEVGEELQASKEEETSLEEEIFGRLEDAVIDEPTRLVDKAQAKIEGVDQFYTFNQKQAEFQAMLDQEYERIQNNEEEELEPIEPEEVELPDFLVEDNTADFAEETVEEEPAELEEAPVTADEPQLVAVVWSGAPAGIIAFEEVANAQAEEAVTPEETAAEEDAVPSEEEGEAEVTPSKDEGEEEKTEKAEEPEHKLTFDDVFRDDDDDEEEKEKGGCLKVIAIFLCILVVIELAILGVQYFAPDSQAGKMIDQGYQYIVNLLSGSEAPEEDAEAGAASEIENIISAQMNLNQNIVSVTENKALLFEEDEDYGYAEMADTYAFQNSPWYDKEDGTSVTFGDAIVGTLIQYYSALPDKMNGVNNDIVDFVDNTSDFYEEVDAIESETDKGYVIKQLEIGEIRTGGSGFYVLASVTIADNQDEEGATEKQIIYLEPNTNTKAMKIIEIQKI